MGHGWYERCGDTAGPYGIQQCKDCAAIDASAAALKAGKSEGLTHSHAYDESKEADLAMEAWMKCDSKAGLHEFREGWLACAKSRASK